MLIVRKKRWLREASSYGMERDGLLLPWNTRWTPGCRLWKKAVLIHVQRTYIKGIIWTKTALHYNAFLNYSFWILHPLIITDTALWEARMLPSFSLFSLFSFSNTDHFIPPVQVNRKYQLKLQDNVRFLHELCLWIQSTNHSILFVVSNIGTHLRELEINSEAQLFQTKCIKNSKTVKLHQ